MSAPTPAPATAERPQPLREALSKVGPAVSAVVALFSGLGSAGIFSAAQVAEVQSYGDSITTAADTNGPIAIAVGAVVGLVTGGLHLFSVLKAGKDATAQTTPITSPRDVDGAALVRADGLPLGGNPYSAA